MFSKINLSNIIKDHISTLRDHQTNKYYPPDFFLFFILPIFVAAGASFLLCPITGNVLDILVTSMSIFAALLFNLLLLVYDAIRKEENSKTLRHKFLKEIFSNISFSVLISVITIIFLLIFPLFSKIFLIPTILTFLIYYLVTLFILTLLMILKRTHVLLTTEP